MNTKYHKINSIFKRDMETKNKLFILGDYADPDVEYLKDNRWVFTEKIDGTNVRVIFDGHDVSFKGRTDNAQLPARLFEHLTHTFPPHLLKDVFSEETERTVVLYGEGCGYKIQKNGEKYVDGEHRQDFILFDVKVGDMWLKRDSVIEIARKLGIRFAPIVGFGTIADAIEMVSGSMTSIYGYFIAEGIVARPERELKDRHGNRIITKIKHRDFVHLKEANAQKVQEKD